MIIIFLFLGQILTPFWIIVLEIILHLERAFELHAPFKTLYKFNIWLC